VARPYFRTPRTFHQAPSAIQPLYPKPIRERILQQQQQREAIEAEKQLIDAKFREYEAQELQNTKVKKKKRFI
jgi:hypothetical protein